MEFAQREKAMSDTMHRLKAVSGINLFPDMTPGEARVLSAICGDALGERKISDLYEACEMHPTAVSRLMNSLEEKELILRNPRKGNRRVTDVCATEHGKRINERNMQILQDFWQEVLQRVPVEEFDTMLGILNEILDSVDQVRDRTLSDRKKGTN